MYTSRAGRKDNTLLSYSDFLYLNILTDVKIIKRENYKLTATFFSVQRKSYVKEKDMPN